MLIGPLAQYPKPPSMPCFTIVLDTLERSPPFYSMPCFDLVLYIGELAPSYYVIPSFSIPPPHWCSISLTTQHFSTSYLCLYPLQLVYVDPFLLSFHFPVFSLLIGKRRHLSFWLDAHEFILTRVFPHYFLGGLIIPYYPTPFPATLLLDALPFHSVFWHLHCSDVSSPSCACFLLDLESECLLHHASKCIP